MCAISEMPEAKNRGSSAAPGISLRNSGANSPNTVETWTPTFSNTRPFIIAMTPPPPGAPLWSVRFHGVRMKRPGARSASGAPAGERLLHRLEGRSDLVAQRLEPRARALFAFLSLSVAHALYSKARCGFWTR